MPAAVTAVAAHLPEGRLTNAELAERYPDWSVEKIGEKTGIDSRRVVADDECASDLAVAAVHKLIGSGACAAEEVDFLLVVTQSPDYLVPSMAPMVQDRLGIPTTAGAVDINLGCSGYVYGLALARGLVETGQAKRLLLVTTDTWSRYLAHADRSVATLFGDGATATLVQPAEEATGPAGVIAATAFGTDGGGSQHLKVATSGLKGFRGIESDDHPEPTLFMDGPEIFGFTLRTVPKHLKQLLQQTGLAADDIDLFVLHQANAFMLEHLRKRMKVPEEKFVLHMAETGNTVSSTIPLALEHCLAEGRIQAGQKVVLVGFGVGLSWGSVLLQY